MLGSISSSLIDDWTVGWPRTIQVMGFVISLLGLLGGIPCWLYWFRAKQVIKKEFPE